MDSTLERRSPVVPASAGATGGRSTNRRRLLGQLGDLLFLLPAVLLVGGFLLVPIGIGIVRSLYNWSPGYASPFVGVKNYTTLAANAAFRQILRNEGIFILAVPLWVILPLIVSLLLYRRVPFAGAVRTLIFFPAVASPAILGIFFRGVLAPDGMLNSAVRSVGAGSLSRNWLAEPNLVKPVMICVLAWSGMGIGVLVFSAALSAVDPSLFEVAELEGANALQRLRYVVLPTLRPVVELYLALQVLTVFTGLFSWIYVLTGGGPGFASTTLDFDIYQHALSYGEFGLAAAESVYLMVIIVIIVLITRRIQRGRLDA